MADFSWRIRRLKAMSVPEMAWRVSQKAMQKNEQKIFQAHKTVVTDTLFSSKYLKIQLDADKMRLNWDTKEFSLNTDIPLLGGYDYRSYKKQWNAGFQTKNEWPEQFSYSLEYKQRDDVGDARTNWELNRHFQFALLAKNYYASRDKRYLTEFQELFEDWNRRNPFLWGISWTSVMEAAIRCGNWCYAWCFLKKSDASPILLKQLQTGILNMTDYVANHYSRYSSANNHLIVEAYAVGQTGILCGYKPWIQLAMDILTRELPLQNYSDGVNKELSLHYQSFYMEAMGLMMRLLIKNNIAVPAQWNPVLERMCAYAADCMGDYGEAVAFGDDDEGKILDLQGGINYYQYVLGLFSHMLDHQYIRLEGSNCENLNWLFSEEERCAARSKPVYQAPLRACYKEGGNTILRSKDRRILIGIDHAALGFGSIAAHGHADALSFQMFVEGRPIFVDPGTYIYHCDLESRNAFRKTENHSTVCMNEKDQSEMLGAFLWGRRAECRLIDFINGQDEAVLIADHNGYFPVIHQREFRFDGRKIFLTIDTFSKTGKYIVNLVLAPEAAVSIKGMTAQFQVPGCHGEICFSCDGKARLYTRETGYSPMYGIKESTTAVFLEAYGRQIKSEITIAG